MDNPASNFIVHSKFQEGQSIGQYLIKKVIGQGGMGQVFEVQHKVLESVHALKVITPSLSKQSKAIEYFEREAKIMASLNHPGIVKVDEFGFDEDHHWIRMELVPGVDTEDGILQTLEDYRRFHAGVVPEENVISCLQQFLDAIGYAHNKGVIHRDLKPSNILLAPSGMKIADFGLARLLPKGWDQTIHSMHAEGRKDAITQALVGTLSYMSPEQKNGQATALGDLWTIALIGYQLLTGKETPSPEPVSSTKPGISPSWDEWFRKALAENPSERFQNAESMQAALPKISPDAPNVSKSNKVPAKPLLPLLCIAGCLAIVACIYTFTKSRDSEGIPLIVKQSKYSIPETSGTKIHSWPESPPASPSPKPNFKGGIPVVQWVHGLNSSGQDAINSVGITSDGHIHTFGTYSNRLGYHVFSAQGKPLRGSTFLSSEETKAQKILVLADQSVLLTATFSGQLYFGEETLQSHGPTDIMVARLDQQGKQLWAFSIGGPGEDEITGLYQLTNGNLIVAGNFNKTLQLSPKSQPIEGYGMQDMFLAILSPEGEILDSKIWGGPGQDHLFGLSTNGDHLQLAGSFSGTSKFDTKKIKSNGMQDLFTAILGNEGEIREVTNFGTALNDSISAFTITTDNTTFLATQHLRPLHSERIAISHHSGGGNYLLSQNNKGEFQQVVSWPNQNKSTIAAITTIPNGPVFTAINFKDQITVADQTWKSRGKTDIILLQFSQEAKLISSNHFGGDEEDYATSLDQFYTNDQLHLLLNGTCGEALFDDHAMEPKDPSTSFTCLLKME